MQGKEAIQKSDQEGVRGRRLPPGRKDHLWKDWRVLAGLESLCFQGWRQNSCV